jgi:hypothetical protein
MFIIAWTIWSLSIVGLLAIPAMPIRSRREVEALRGNSSGNTVATSYSKSASKLIPIIPGRTRP